MRVKEFYTPYFTKTGFQILASAKFKLHNQKQFVCFK